MGTLTMLGRRVVVLLAALALPAALCAESGSTSASASAGSGSEAIATSTSDDKAAEGATDPGSLFKMQGQWEAGASKLQKAQYDVQIAFHRMNFATQARNVAQGRLSYANGVIYAAESVENTTKEYRDAVNKYEQQAADGAKESEKIMKTALSKKKAAEAKFTKAAKAVQTSSIKAYTSNAAAAAAGVYSGYGMHTGFGAAPFGYAGWTPGVLGGYGMYSARGRAFGSYPSSGFAGLGAYHGLDGVPTEYWKNQEALTNAAKDQWKAGAAANAAAAEAAAAGQMKGTHDISAMRPSKRKHSCPCPSTIVRHRFSGPLN